MNDENCTPKAQNSETFQGKNDRFNGVIVDSILEPCNLEIFSNKLKESLKVWTEAKRRGIWFKVATEHADWVPILVKNGFRFHHAKEHFVMLCKWLPKEETPNIPNFAHTLLGVGAIVINDKNQVLVVKERYCIYQPHWKFPGGYIEPGEDIVKAGIREVEEETGIKATFHSLVAVRHIHKAMFECSDMYFVLSLKALTEKIKKCDREISECIWTDIDKFLKDPQTHETNRLFLEKYLENKNNHFQIEHLVRIHEATQKQYHVFAGTKEN